MDKNKVVAKETDRQTNRTTVRQSDQQSDQTDHPFASILAVKSHYYY